MDACFLRFLGPKSYKFKFSWPLAKSGCLFPEVFWTNILIFIYHHVGITKVRLFWVGSVAQEAFRGERQGQLWAQDAHISSLPSQFWTFLCRPTLTQWENVEVTSWRFLWCVWTCMGCYFGPFSNKEMREIHVLQNTEIRFENTRNTRTRCAMRSSRPESSESV